MKEYELSDDQADYGFTTIIATCIATTVLSVLAAHQTLRLAVDIHSSIWLAILLSATSGLAGLAAAKAAASSMGPAIVGAAMGAIAILVVTTVKIPIGTAITFIILAVSLGGVAIGVAMNLQAGLRHR